MEPVQDRPGGHLGRGNGAPADAVAGGETDTGTRWGAVAGAGLDRLRRRRPLIHHLTSPVVAQWTANITLAWGASPLMAREPGEFPVVARAAGALVLNLGGLRAQEVEQHLAAQREARRRGIPIVLDPVGAGFTPLRTQAALQLLAGGVTAVRGNGGEILALAAGQTAGELTRGVDSGPVSLDQVAQGARQLARRHGCVVIATGAVDVITDGDVGWLVHNGHPWLAAITGGGCGATATVAAFLAGSPHHLHDAAVAMALYGLAAERAAARSTGPGSFQAALLDEIYALGPGAAARSDGLRIRPFFR